MERTGKIFLNFPAVAGLQQDTPSPVCSQLWYPGPHKQEIWKNEISGGTKNWKPLPPTEEHTWDCQESLTFCTASVRYVWAQQTKNHLSGRGDSCVYESTGMPPPRSPSTKPLESPEFLPGTMGGAALQQEADGDSFQHVTYPDKWSSFLRNGSDWLIIFPNHADSGAVGMQ